MTRQKIEIDGRRRTFLANHFKGVKGGARGLNL
jgi:hypothetical protein